MSTFSFTDISVSTSFTNTGTSAGGRRGAVSVGTAAGPTALGTADSSGVYVATAGSGNQEWVLPAATTAGLVYTFVCGNASGEILIGVTGNDTCSCKASEGGASVVTSATHGLKNTAATNVVGDQITLVSDGVSQWDMVAQSGTWATR